jgi:Tfp pilus assembly protein PilV
MDQLVRLRFRRKKVARNGEQGMSLIEVMIAGMILTVGMLGYALLMATSIMANSRSRADSTSVMLAQSALDQLAATTLASASTTMIDCAGTSVTAATAVGGAATTANDEIDWTEASPPTGYHMTYTICASTNSDTSNAQQRSYDVRWNVAQVSATQAQTYLIIIGVRPTNYTTNLKQFMLPVNLKTYVGPHSTTP